MKNKIYLLLIGAVALLMHSCGGAKSSSDKTVVTVSLEPQKYIRDLKKRVEEIDKTLEPILDEFEIKFLNVGVTPKTT